MNPNPDRAKLAEHIMDEKDAKWHRWIVDSLLYVAIATRSDFCLAACSLGAHVKSPCQADLMATKGVSRFLKRTSDRSFMWKPALVNQISAYVNSIWGAAYKKRIGELTLGYSWNLSAPLYTLPVNCRNQYRWAELNNNDFYNLITWAMNSTSVKAWRRPSSLVIPRRALPYGLLKKLS